MKYLAGLFERLLGESEDGTWQGMRLVDVLSDVIDCIVGVSAKTSMRRQRRMLRQEELAHAYQHRPHRVGPVLVRELTDELVKVALLVLGLRELLVLPLSLGRALLLGARVLLVVLVLRLIPRGADDAVDVNAGSE